MKRRPSFLDVVLVRVTPDPSYAEALERKRAELTYRPRNAPFHRDIQQPRVEETLPALLRKQA
jgi:hypothetical protein